MDYPTFTSESVCSGHPDKICDQISDAMVDAALAIDKNSRVAIETLVTTNHVTLAGEVTCPKWINYEKIARRVIADLGYTKKEYGFTDEAEIEVLIHTQSPDIAQGVDNGGAGDQGMMFGYACNETEELMPLPIMISHALVKKMDEVKKKGMDYLRPDGKSEVTISYEKGRPAGVERIVLAVPHNPGIEKEQLKNDLFKFVVEPTLEKYKQKQIKRDQMIINGTGKWEIGGPAADTGVTGRKIIVDSYGGMARVGGGCFSGKDVTKVDRSAAYGTRYVAKNIVAAGLAERCEVQAAYVIGFRDPIAKAIETFGTARTTDKKMNEFAWSLLDMSVQGIVEGLDLRRPIYQQTARYGHFGNQEYPWEKIYHAA
jgi:S-adenosylmethionine synthetase